ncbi:MAG: CHASE2 domain-containing protein [Candidatus Cloacimonadia bacterium]
MRKSRLKFWGIFSLIIFVVALIISFLPISGHWENSWLDTCFSFRGPLPISKDIVLVNISEDTLDKLGRLYLPRNYYAQLIENLNEAGARLIIFTLDFTVPSVAAEDKFFAEIASQYKNVLLAGRYTEHPAGDTLRVIPPIQPLTSQNIPWGISGALQDPDGSVRQYTPFAQSDNCLYYSLGIKALQMLASPSTEKPIPIQNTRTHITVGPHILPKYTSSTVLINFYGPQGTFPIYPLYSVLDDANFTTLEEQESGTSINTFEQYKSEGIFRDKIAIIGASVPSLQQLFLTPFYNFHHKKAATSRAEIEANFLEMTFQNHFISKCNYFPFLLFLLGGIFVVNLLFISLKPTFSTILLIVLVVGFFWFSSYMFSNQNIVIPVVAPQSALLFGYIGILTYHFINKMKEKQALKSAFQYRLSSESLRHTIRSLKELNLLGEKRTITALVIHIYPRSSLPANYDPKELLTFMRRFHTLVTSIITQNNGYVDRFANDRALAIFGAPLKNYNHAYNACKAAIKLSSKFTKFREDNKKLGKHFQIEMGIHTGESLVGNLGTEYHIDYSAFGLTLKLTNYIALTNADFATSLNIVISNKTYEEAKEKIEARFLDTKQIEWTKESVSIYELAGLK